MKKKIMSVILVFMLVISVSLLNVSIIKAEVSSDTEGPIIETVSINTHNVTSGDSVTVTATVSDESAIDHIYAYFYLSGTNNWHAANLELQDDGTYQGTLAITDAWINGTYNIDLVIAEDVKGNSTSLKK